MPVVAQPAPPARCTLARWMTVLFIVLTAAVSLSWSHAKLLSQDEMYAFQTDRVPTLHELIEVQRHWPISLDPLLDHALAHGAIVLFGANAFAQRLPALAGFLLMQVCLFFFVRNLAGDRAGAVAAALPALTHSLFYSAEGRPYGLLLGLYALALWCWQVAARRTQEAGRRLALAGLALAIAATVNAHYFGVLLLVPLWAGELWRMLARRRAGLPFDWPVPAALVAGMAGIAFTVPFLAGAAEFKKHYYNAGTVGLHDISRAYRTLFLDYTQMSTRTQHLAMVVLVAYAAAVVWGCWRVWRAGRIRIPQAEWVALLALAALPFCGYLLARFVTHSIEVRYVLGALVALTAMTAVALAPLLRRDAAFNALLVLLGVGIVAGGVLRVRSEQRATEAALASLTLPAQAEAALAASPDKAVYVQNMGVFEMASYYTPDPALRRRITLIYSYAAELRWNGHDTNALTAEHLQHFTDLNVVSYEDLAAHPGPHVFALKHTGWDWTDQAFAADGATVSPLGQALGGDMAAVSFSASR